MTTYEIDITPKTASLAAEDSLGGRQFQLSIPGIGESTGSARFGAVVGHLTASPIFLNGAPAVATTNGVAAS